jgi:hypothetical protein
VTAKQKERQRFVRWWLACEAERAHRGRDDDLIAFHMETAIEESDDSEEARANPVRP